MAIILDGKNLSAKIQEEIKCEIAQLEIIPHLSVYLVGDDPRSLLYVNAKIKACQNVGIRSRLTKIPSSDSNYLLRKIRADNANKSVHGILVQLPLPASFPSISEEIDPKKDVDCFHPENLGFLVQNRPRFKPCTPSGIQQLLTRNGISFDGKRVVIINRSLIVGQPLATMLLQDVPEGNATITVCHDHTPAKLLKEITQEADILITAVGKPDYRITADMVKLGAVVVDVAIRVVKNKKICGDVDFEAVKNVAGYLTPVPGGVGPMTIVGLLQNTLRAAKCLQQ